MNSEPVCLRHPDRVTYVSCTRCGNPICHECMIDAPVGFQCPSCVASGRLQRRIRTDEPRVTYALISLCVAVQVAGMIGIGTASGYVAELSMFPARIAVFGEYYRLITCVFVHAGLLHLGMNMLMLWVLGRSLESMLGGARMLALFLIAGVGGAVASYWFNDPLTAGVGASGAVFGMLGALFVLGRERGVNTQEIVGIIGINLVLGFLVPGVDWRAHLGGLVVGAAAGWALLPQRRRLAAALLTPLVLFGVVAAALARTATLGAALGFN